MGTYDVMQVCLNGHQITSMAVRSPEFTSPFCASCGAQTVTQCPSCSARIRGRYMGGGFSLSGIPVPAYCDACGAPYPWTERKIEAAVELIDLAEGVSPKEKEALKSDLPALLTDNPRTQVAAANLKLFVANAGKTIGTAVYQIAVDVASETAKKALGL